jgi:hypothetical protein
MVIVHYSVSVRVSMMSPAATYSRLPSSRDAHISCVIALAIKMDPFLMYAQASMPF